MSHDFASIQVEDWLHGPLRVSDSEEARANKRALDRHLQAEWSSDLEATMATIHPREPWQVIHGLGVDVRGFEAVRDYYARRFDNWPGPGMEHFDRVTVTEACAYLECRLSLEPQGEFAGRAAEGRKLDVPAVIVIDFEEGLVVGETVYLDSALARVQLGEQAAGGVR